MELPFILPLKSGKQESVTVWKTEFVIANATVSIISLTVISVGIPIATVITLDTTYTCWLLLDSAHDAMPYYDYCKKNNITPFIDLNWKCGRPPVYKDDISINSDGIPLCPKGFSMKQAAVEPRKGRIKYRCPKISYKGCTPHCTCDESCSDAKYGRMFTLY